MNRRRIPRFLFLVALAAAAGGCAVADTGAFVRLQDEVVALKKDVARLKGAPPSSATAAAARTGGADAGDLSALQKRVADLTADTDQVKADILAATTRSDENKVQLQKEIAQLTDKVNDQAQAVQEQKSRLARVEEIERRLSALEEKLEKIQAAQAAQAPAPVPAPSGGGKEWKTPEEMYDNALGLIKGGQPKKGREILSSFTAKYPGHKLTPNVFYWKGETYYLEKDYENAILSFQDVVDKFPAGEKAPDAMFKQGLSFLALKDRKNARVLFELVQTKYPKTAAAVMARKKLSELK
jgi:tol-pal system protein YbgF